MVKKINLAYAVTATTLYYYVPLVNKIAKLIYRRIRNRFGQMLLSASFALFRKTLDMINHSFPVSKKSQIDLIMQLLLSVNRSEEFEVKDIDRLLVAKVYEEANLEGLDAKDFDLPRNPLLLTPSNKSLINSSSQEDLSIKPIAGRASDHLPPNITLHADSGIELDDRDGNIDIVMDRGTDLVNASLDRNQGIELANAQPACLPVFIKDTTSTLVSMSEPVDEQPATNVTNNQTPEQSKINSILNDTEFPALQKATESMPQNPKPTKNPSISALNHFTTEKPLVS